MNHKRLISLLLSLVLLLGMVPAITVSAAETASGTCGENLTWTLEDGALTISGSGDMDDFESQNSPWYEYRNSITEIIIGDEVTSIGEYAFEDCRSVLELTIPASVKLIGYLAFDTAYNIDSIIFLGDAPELVTSKVSNGCIYNGHPFNGIVATVYYPAENATWTESCRENYSPFSDSFSWIALSESELNATVPVSGTCGKNMTWKVTEDGVLTISGSGRMDDYEWNMSPWFRFRKHITSLLIEDGVTYIGEHAFQTLYNLTDVTISSSVKTIGASSFMSCGSIAELTIPAGVTKINCRAFNYCYGLKAVFFQGDLPEFVDKTLIDSDYVSVGIFIGVKANMYYPKDNTTWRSFMYKDFGGKLTWDRYDPAAHTHVYTTVVTNATCLTDGYTTYTCACGDSYVGDKTTALGHNYQDGYCLVCGVVDPDVERLAGANRWATSLAVADKMKDNLGLEKFDAIIIASGDNFADALAGSYLSAVKSAPILLCWNGGGRFEYLNQNILDYIDANLAEDGTVYILGGKGAVPMSFDEALGDRVNRLNGSNRFETNLMILKEAGVKADEEILVCTSTNFADSLSASATGKPILLVFNEGGKLFDNQIAYLETLSGNTFTILGGNGAVSEKLAGLIGAYGAVSRLAGANRFETSVLVAETYFDSPDTVVLAYAWNYPDGLCGGSLAYSLNAPLILTMAKYEASATKYIGKNSVSTGTVLGGPSLIPDDSIDKLYSESKA